MVLEKNKDIQNIKKDLRKKILSKALALPEVYKSDADARITQLLLGLPEYKMARTIFCFVGVEHEINTRPFLEQVLADGKRLAVPLCVGKGVMEARRIFSLDELKKGYYGLYEPDKSSEIIPMDEVEFAVIPCLQRIIRAIVSVMAVGFTTLFSISIIMFRLLLFAESACVAACQRNPLIIVFR